MEHIIIGTAGHIDHGKTTLIRALTGRDTDRLAEEKKRGITIDLGFTYFDLPDGNRAGIIDVPGHEKFIHNMVAGVVGMDLVMLVIALDEGIMPQTTEHMEILNQLGITQCIVVLNKADLVDEDWEQMVVEDIKDKLSSTVFADAPMVKVSAKTGAGILELLQVITEKLKTMNHKKHTAGHFRLPIDRVFSVSGFGTIVTGTLLEGSIHIDDAVKLFPGNKETKIRGIQVHGSDVMECYHGQRVALNLANVKKDEIRRGDVVAPLDSMENTLLLDVRMNVIQSTDRVIENRTRLHLYMGTDELLCRAVLLDQEKLGPGESGFVQLRLEKPLAVRKGDRFILRFYSPLETIGGGIVLDAHPMKHKRFDHPVISYLAKKEEGKDRDIVEDILVEAYDMPLSKEQLVKHCALDAGYLDEILEGLVKEGIAVIISGNKKKFYWSFDAEKRMEGRILDFIMEYHRKNPYKPGIGKSVLMSECFKGWQMDKYDAILKKLTESNLLKRTGDIVSVYDFYIIQDETYQKVKNTMTKAFQKAGYDFIRLEDIDYGNVTNNQSMDIVMNLLAEEYIVKLIDDFYTLSSVMESAQDKIKEYFTKEEVISIATVRDLLGTSRRNAKPILFYMDTVKVTRWNGKETERIAY